MVLNETFIVAINQLSYNSAIVAPRMTDLEVVKNFCQSWSAYEWHMATLVLVSYCAKLLFLVLRKKKEQKKWYYWGERASEMFFEMFSLMFALNVFLIALF